MFKKLGNPKGMFLISSFLVMSVVGTFSLALFLKSTTIFRTIEHARNRIIAFHLAEAGVDRAIIELENDRNYAGQAYTALGNNGGFNVAVDAPDPNNDDIRRIIANGFTPNNSPFSYAYENRRVTVYANIQSGGGFPGPVFGDQEVTMSGRAMTDSYNSNNPPYVPGGSNGDVGTNSTASGAVTLSGQATVNGDAFIGPGGDPSSGISTSGQATISGNQTAAPSPTPMPAVQIPSSLINKGDFSLGGQTTETKPGGTYWFESISISGGANLKFSGPTTIYVTKSVSLSGNGTISSLNDAPPNLIIKVKGDDGVSISGGGKFYGAIYAPKADFSISGNGELFGGVMGNKIKMSGGGHDEFMVHYDEALKTSGGAGSQPHVSMRSWQES